MAKNLPADGDPPASADPEDLGVLLDFALCAGGWRSSDPAVTGVLAGLVELGLARLLEGESTRPAALTDDHRREITARSARYATDPAGAAGATGAHPEGFASRLSRAMEVLLVTVDARRHGTIGPSDEDLREGGVSPGSISARGTATRQLVLVSRAYVVPDDESLVGHFVRRPALASLLLESAGEIARTFGSGPASIVDEDGELMMRIPTRLPPATAHVRFSAFLRDWWMPRADCILTRGSRADLAIEARDKMTLALEYLAGPADAGRTVLQEARDLSQIERAPRIPWSGWPRWSRPAESSGGDDARSQDLLRQVRRVDESLRIAGRAPRPARAYAAGLRRGVLGRLSGEQTELRSAAVGYARGYFDAIADAGDSLIACAPGTAGRDLWAHLAEIESAARSEVDLADPRAADPIRLSRRAPGRYDVHLATDAGCVRAACGEHVDDLPSQLTADRAFATCARCLALSGAEPDVAVCVQVAARAVQYRVPLDDVFRRILTAEAERGGYLAGVARAVLAAHAAAVPDLAGRADRQRDRALARESSVGASPGASLGSGILGDLAYAARMEARRPKCPTCGEPAAVGGAVGFARDGAEVTTGYAFTCPNRHHWETSPVVGDASVETRARLLAEFSDLLNRCGVDSREVREFRRTHGQDGDLARLLDAAVRVRGQLKTGQLVDRTGDSGDDARLCVLCGEVAWPGVGGTLLVDEERGAPREISICGDLPRCALLGFSRALRSWIAGHRFDDDQDPALDTPDQRLVRAHDRLVALVGDAADPRVAMTPCDACGAIGRGNATCWSCVAHWHWTSPELRRRMVAALVGRPLAEPRDPQPTGGAVATREADEAAKAESPAVHRARLGPWSLGELKEHLASVADGLAVRKDLSSSSSSSSPSFLDVAPLDVALELLGGELEAFVLFARIGHLDPPSPDGKVPIAILQQESRDPAIDEKIRGCARGWSTGDADDDPDSMLLLRRRPPPDGEPS